MRSLNSLFLLLCLIITGRGAYAQQLKWNSAGNAFYQRQNGSIYAISATDGQRTELVTAAALTPPGAGEPLPGRHFTFTPDEKGKFAIACGFPTHALAGHWIYLIVGDENTKPTYQSGDEVIEAK